MIFMGRVIHLKGSVVTLYEDRVSVKDGAQRNKTTLLFTSCLWIFYGLMNLWRYFETKEEEYQLWVGIVICLLWLVNLVRGLYISGKKEIRLYEIKKTRFRSSLLTGDSLVLELNNGLGRKINNISPVASGLRGYFAEHGL